MTPLGDDTPVFVISVAAELSGMHPQTLRQYDRLGLVTPGRSGGGGRRYSARDVALLREVQRLSQEEGVNLAGIKRVIELENQVEASRPASRSWPASSSRPRRRSRSPTTGRSPVCGATWCRAEERAGGLGSPSAADPPRTSGTSTDPLRNTGETGSSGLRPHGPARAATIPAHDAPGGASPPRGEPPCIHARTDAAPPAPPPAAPWSRSRPPRWPRRSPSRRTPRPATSRAPRHGAVRAARPGCRP
jgi:MerR family transcriptional regulator/heat shock protein HspR